MALGFNHIIAPRPVEISVQSQSVANALTIMAFLPREGGDERHIGINEWLDRVRLSLTEEQLYEVALVMWGIGHESLINAVEHPDAQDDFDVYLRELDNISATDLRDTCVYWLLHSTHRRVYIDADPLEPTSIADLLSSRERFIAYLYDNITKFELEAYFDGIVGLYFEPKRLKALVLKVLAMLWHDYFKNEWVRHQDEINRVVSAFSQVPISNMPTFDAMQMITGRDLRPIFRLDVLSELDRIIFIPSKHNGPYISWFGNESTLYIVFTARMPESTIPSGDDNIDLNVLIQRFKALSDESRLQVLLAIAKHGELSTQDLIQKFDFNKSAVSRYVGQLFANGFITERRDSDGKTKFYRINPEVIDTFLQSIHQLLKK